MQLGIESEEAEQVAEAAGLTVVMNRCMGTTHGALGLAWPRLSSGPAPGDLIAARALPGARAPVARCLVDVEESGYRRCGMSMPGTLSSLPMEFVNRTVPGDRWTSICMLPPPGWRSDSPSG